MAEHPYIDIYSPAGNEKITGQLQSLLSFYYSTNPWTVAINNILIYNPKIPGVLYRSGNQLMISTG